MRKNFVNLQRLRRDIRSLTSSYRLSEEDLQWFSKIYRTAVFSRKLYEEEGPGRNQAGHKVMLIHYRPDKALKADARKVLEWFAALPEDSKHKYAADNTFTLRRALEELSRSERQELFNARVEAAALADRFVETDPERAPEVLDLGSGWKVVWLQTEAAREAEEQAMVVRLAPLLPGVENFSLRHNDRSYSTFSVADNGGCEFTTHPCEYADTWALAQKATTILRCRLMVSRDPAKTLEDGMYRLEDGTIAHVQAERLHHESEAAVIYPDGTREWYRDGKLDRENGPAVEHPNGRGEWYRNGRLYYGSELLKAKDEGIFEVEEEPGLRPQL